MQVINRAGFDPAPLNKIVQESVPEAVRLPGQPPVLYGPTLDYVAAAPRLIEGTVREAGSGKPLASITVWSSIGSGNDDRCTAVTDKQGRYRLTGLPKMKEVLLHAWADKESNWLPGGARVRDQAGLEPIQADLTMVRGVAVSGRVIDRATGKPVPSAIRSVPLPNNKFFGKPGYDAYNYSGAAASFDYEGRFRLVVLPGPVVLIAQATPTMNEKEGRLFNPYKMADFDSKDRERVRVLAGIDGDRYFFAAGGSTEFLASGHAVKYLEFAPDAGKANADLFVDSGKKLTVKIQDAEGKPLKGVLVAGVTATPPYALPFKDAECPVFALDPKSPRRLLFLHPERRLAGTLIVRGDEKEPPVARLTRAGTVKGRILDADGQPIAGADIRLSPVDRKARELYDQVKSRTAPIPTDKEGRFHLEGMIPDMKFSVSIHQGRHVVAGPAAHRRAAGQIRRDARFRRHPHETATLG